MEAPTATRWPDQQDQQAIRIIVERWSCPVLPDRMMAVVGTDGNVTTGTGHEGSPHLHVTETIQIPAESRHDGSRHAIAQETPIRETNQLVRSFLQAVGSRSRTLCDIHPCLHQYSHLDRDGSPFSLQRYLAAGHQHGDNHHHFSDGLSDSAHSEHRVPGRTDQA